MRRASMWLNLYDCQAVLNWWRKTPPLSPTFFFSLIKMSVDCQAYILFLGTLTMYCLGVAMIIVGAKYKDDVSKHLIIGGISVIILYLLPLLVVSIYIKETRNGENFWRKYAVVSFMLPYCFPLLLVPLVYPVYLLVNTGILIWGTIKASGNKSS